MKYEVVESRTTAGEWRVEYVKHESEGEVEVALFLGRNSQQRAREYAAWKNREGIRLAQNAGRIP